MHSFKHINRGLLIAYACKINKEHINYIVSIHLKTSVRFYGTPLQNKNVGYTGLVLFDRCCEWPVALKKIRNKDDGKRNERCTQCSGLKTFLFSLPFVRVQTTLAPSFGQIGDSTKTGGTDESSPNLERPAWDFLTVSARVCDAMGQQGQWLLSNFVR